MRTIVVNRTSLLAIAVAAVGVAGCSERTLLPVDVTGDRRFEDVVLRLRAARAESSAAPREADFPNVRFDTTSAYKAGLYLPADWSGTVTVTARVIEGACEVAAGNAIAHDVRAEESNAVVSIVVVSHASCIPVGDGSAGGSGGASGAGGAGGTTGAGGGAGSGRGGGGTGAAGGAAGSGGGSGRGGASGGRGGTGGAAGSGGGAGGGQTGTGGNAGAGGRGGGGGAGGRGGTGGAAGTGGGIAGASGMGGGVVAGAGGAMGGTFGGSGGAGARGGAGGSAGRGGSGGAGGCSQSNADACGARNCGSVQNLCGQSVLCGTCRDDQCCDLGVCGPAGNPPRC